MLAAARRCERDRPATGCVFFNIKDRWMRLPLFAAALDRLAAAFCKARLCEENR
jgi:hypothetical protein